MSRNKEKSFNWFRMPPYNLKKVIDRAAVLVTLLSLVMLYGCSERIEINSISVVGTSTSINGIVPINAGFNNGRFIVSWSVLVESGKLFDFEAKDRGYTIRLHLSDDDELSSSTDLRFYSEECGTSDSTENCNDDENGSIRCTFTNENKIVCGASIDQQETDISDWLGELPKRANLILEACHDDGDPCDRRSVQIELR